MGYGGAALPQPLTERDWEVLNELCPSYSDEAVRWLIPLDIGASNGSHHNYVLNKLASRGLVQFKPRGAEDPEGWENDHRRFGARGSKVYRITPAGIAALDERRGKPRQTRAEWQAWFDERQAQRLSERNQLTRSS